MQYEQLAGGGRVDLPRPSIDTGMGLERIAAVLQGTHDNYKIDLFGALIEAVADSPASIPTAPQKASHRVIADHLRATSFLIADGVLPSNEGRGYVLRRIMRRAMRHAELLGAKDPLMWRLVPTLVREMGQAYPELHRAEALITETLKLEETRFRRTLERGLAILDEASSRSKGDMFDGETAFTLYDTYGFPLDLTQDALKIARIGVDIAAFTEAMERQREMARASWTGSGEAADEAVWFALREKSAAPIFSATRPKPPQASLPRCCATARKCCAEEGRKRRCGAQPDAVLRRIRRPGRRYRAMTGDGVRFARHRYAKAGRRSVRPFRHRGAGHTQGRHRADAGRRSRAAPRDSAKSFGNPPVARGAAPGARRSCRAERLAGRARSAALRLLASEADERRRDRTVEDIANDIVLQNAPVMTRLMAVDDAIASGARALFGEKYGDEVRVVAMGEGGGNAMGWSVELCGGTHVGRTGDIGLISVIGECAVGVRRAPHRGADRAKRRGANANNLARLAKATASELRVPVEEMPARVAALLDERKRLERELSEAKKKLAMGGGAQGDGADGVRDVGDVKLMARAVEGIDLKDLRSLADEGKKKVGSGVVAIVGVTEDGKAGIVVGVTDDLVARFNAVDLVRKGAEALGGKGGGGRPDMAQAGGPDGSKADAALAAIEAALGA